MTCMGMNEALREALWGWRSRLGKRDTCGGRNTWRGTRKEGAESTVREARSRGTFKGKASVWKGWQTGMERYDSWGRRSPRLPRS